MTAFSFTSIIDTTVPFNPANDSLNFSSGYNATSLSLTQSGSNLVVTCNGSSAQLANLTYSQLLDSNLVFADGSLFLRDTAGNDTRTGSTTADQIIITGGGNDIVSANAGDDIINVGSALNSSDTINGGAGTHDKLLINGNTTVILNATTVNDIEDFVIGAGGVVNLTLNNAIFTSVSPGGIVNFNASAQGQADSLVLNGSSIGANNIIAVGGDGADSLTGGAGNDSLQGGVGADTLVGNAGNDTLTGGLGADNLTGGTGSDRFVFGLSIPRTDASPTTIDTVTDFSTGDLIDLPGFSSVNGLNLVFNTAALNFNYTGGNSGYQVGSNDNDGFIDVFWKNNSVAGRLEIWVDGNDDGQFSETDLLIHLPNTVTGLTSLSSASFADNFIAWRGTDGDDNYIGNNASNQAFALGGNDTMAGGLGDDQLYGGTGNDTLNGDDGDDQLYGGSGADTLNGGIGFDYLIAEGQNTPNSSSPDAPGTINVLNGGAGNDQLQGGAGDDQLNGDADHDTLNGGDGDDTLNGGIGTDTLDGGAGSDTLLGGAGDDILRTGGSYPLAQGSMTDTLSGGDGNDQLFLSDGSYSSGDKAVLTGGLGADRFVLSGANADNIAAGSNNFSYYRYSPVSAPDRIVDFNSAEGDLLRSGITNGLGDYSGNIPLVWRGAAAVGFTATLGQSMALAGSDASDTRFLELWKTYDSASNTTQLFMDRNRDFAVDADDFLLKFTGNIPLDYNSFTAGTFTVKVGTAGNDTNTTPALGAGTDIAFGLTGNDTLNSLDGDDTLNGDGGNDILSGGLGNDFLYGGIDDDTLNGDDGNDQLYGGIGADTLNGGNGIDTLYAEGYRDATVTAWADTEAPGTVNILNGGAGDDSLIGSTGDDQLNGDADNDNLYGNDGNDTLNGGDGNDRLDSGSGNNTLLGGAGADSFYIGYGNNGIAETNLLNGGSGNDLFELYNPTDTSDSATLTGGTGKDIYKIQPEYQYNSTNSITDFVAGINGDVINITSLTNIISGNPFDPTKGYLRLLQSGADTLLQNDIDGASSQAYGWKTVLILKNLDLTVTPLTKENFSPVKVPYVGTNNPPQLTSAPAILPNGTEDSVYTVTTTDLLAGWTDSNGDILSVQNLSANHGAVTNNNDGTYAIQPEANYHGAVTLNYQVSDGTVATATTLGFSLAAANHAPTVANAITDQNATENTTFNFVVPANAFADIDVGDTLTYSATLDNSAALPSWLTFNAATRTFSGTPLNANVGTINVKVTATDGSNASANDIFTIAVASSGAGVMLFSTAGNDILAGTSSLNDTVSYASATAAVTVSLTVTTQQNTVGAGLDTLTNIENLIGGNFNDSLTGSTKNNTLNGGAGNDTLNGGTGADTLIGGLGDDSYVVDNIGDAITENFSEGTDKVSSKVTYTLSGNVENLTLTGSLAINGTGNDLANKLTGNSATNQLDGGAGDDTLDGKAGVDTLIGGLGNDSYVVDDTSDVITENLGEGTDKVSSSATYTLPANVENLTLTGTLAINSTGNGQANKITGNSGNNQLDGGAGNDTLDGGTGTNSLAGGAGKDIFKFITASHTDTITDFIVVDDTIQLENSIFTALTTTGTVAVSQFKIGASALDANDFVIYNSTTGKLLYDADGNGAGAAVQIAMIGAGLSLTNADIVVI